MRGKIFFLLFFFLIKTYGQVFWRIEKIDIEGNKKTKNYVILRECPARVGDSIKENQIDDLVKTTENNLMRTQLFVYDSVFIHKIPETKSLHVKIKVKERWYIIPATYVSFLDRNINAWFLNKDWKRILAGCYLVLDNTTGNKDRLYIHAAYGYNQILGIVYRFPYLNKKQTLGVRAEYTFEQAGNMQYGISDNKQLTKYSPFPYLLRSNTTGASVLFRPKTQTEHKFNFYYKKITGSDTLFMLQPDFFYNKNKNFQFMNIGYEFSFDIRDNKFNPSSGFSFFFKTDFNFNKSGFNNTTHFVSFQYHKNISKRWIGSLLLAGRFMNDDSYPGYFFMRGLGYGNLTLRGYEYFIMDGGNFKFFRSTLRYQILPMRYFRIPIKFIRQFNTVPIALELTTFFDAGYTYNDYDNLPKTIFKNTSIPYGYGTGIQISSYYDLVIRLEFSFTPYLRGFYLGFGSGF